MQENSFQENVKKWTVAEITDQIFADSDSDVSLVEGDCMGDDDDTNKSSEYACDDEPHGEESVIFSDSVDSDDITSSFPLNTFMRGNGRTRGGARHGMSPPHSVMPMMYLHSLMP